MDLEIFVVSFFLLFLYSFALIMKLFLAYYLWKTEDKKYYHWLIWIIALDSLLFVWASYDPYNTLVTHVLQSTVYCHQKYFNDYFIILSLLHAGSGIIFFLYGVVAYFIYKKVVYTYFIVLPLYAFLFIGLLTAIVAFLYNYAEDILGGFFECKDSFIHP